MGVRLTSGENKVALFDSGSGIAFGPVFDDEIEAEAFLGWLPEDARSYSLFELEQQHLRWQILTQTEAS